MKKFLTYSLAILSTFALFGAASTQAQATEAAPTVEEVPVFMTEATLIDGTKISIEGENVFVVSDDGSKTPAPDGDHQLADGSVLKTKGGKAVQ